MVHPTASLLTAEAKEQMDNLTAGVLVTPTSQQNFADGMWANKSLCRLLGYTLAELTARHARGLFLFSDSTSEQSWYRCILMGYHRLTWLRWQDTIRNRRGDIIPVDVVRRHFYDNEGVTIAAIVTVNVMEQPVNTPTLSLEDTYKARHPLSAAPDGSTDQSATESPLPTSLLLPNVPQGLGCGAAARLELDDKDHVVAMDSESEVQASTPPNRAPSPRALPLFDNVELHQQQQAHLQKLYRIPATAMSSAVIHRQDPQETCVRHIADPMLDTTSLPEAFQQTRLQQISSSSESLLCDDTTPFRLQTNIPWSPSSPRSLSFHSPRPRAAPPPTMAAVEALDVSTHPAPVDLSATGDGRFARDFALSSAQHDSFHRDETFEGAPTEAFRDSAVHTQRPDFTDWFNDDAGCT